MTDFDMAANWLDTWYGNAAGFRHISSAGDWSGAAFDSTEAALEDVIRRASQNPQGVYFRCLTLATRPAAGKRGGADQSLALPGMWSDIDFGDAGHKHVAGEDGLPLPPDETAAWAVADRSGLPTPSIVVNSGGGLNVYWTLKEPYIVEDRHRHHVAELAATWQRILGDSARKLGYDYGTGVGELARVLRMPGTDNRKTDTPRPCRIVWTTGASYTIAELADVAARLAPPPAPTAPRPDGHAPPRPTTEPSTRAGGVGPFDVLVDTIRFADLLEPVGWSYVGSDSNGEKWLRPGGADGPPSSAYSARAYIGGKPVLVVHSENAGLPSGPGCDLTPGRVFSHLHHRGDERAAAGDLLKAAAGNPEATAAARRLPASALAAIRTQCNVTTWTEPTSRQENFSPVGTLAGLLRSILRADAGDRLHRLGWAADKTFQHATRGLFDAKNAGDALMEAALTAGIDEGTARKLISSAYHSTTKGVAQ